MGRGVDMRGGPSPNDGGYYGSYGRGFGIKKRSWFGGRSRLLGSRPAFMEPLPGVPPGVPPPHDGGASGGAGGGAGGGLRIRNSLSSSRSYFQDDAGYIGYLTDDDESSGSGSGNDEGNHNNIMRMVRRRRRELIGHDISFSNCMLLMTTVGCLLLLFMFAVSPWGVPPPRRL
jgi:hypothetical protein